MDGPVPAVLCDVSSNPGRAFVVVLCLLGGDFFWNFILVAIIAHGSCSNRGAGIHR